MAMTKSLSGEIRHQVDMQRTWVIAVFMMFAALLAGCATTPTTHTEVTGSWKANSYKGRFANLLVVSHAADPGIREKVESIMVKSLEKQGLHAVASSDIMPADERVTRKTIGAAMAGKGFDGVLVSRLLDVKRSTIYIPPSEDTTFESSFDDDAPIVFSPGYVERLSLISIRNNLYDAVSKRLVWSLQSQTENFGTVNDLVQSVSQAVINDLRARGLI
jgi:hypothetical protein